MVEFFSDPRLLVVDVAILAAAVVGLLLALVIEVRTGRVPNWLTFSLLAAGFGGAVADDRWTAHLLGFGLAAIISLLFYGRGWVPAGIAKLAMGLGLLAGALPALSGLLLIMAVWPLHAWLVSLRCDQRLDDDDLIHCAPQFVAGAVTAFVVVLALGSGG